MRALILTGSPAYSRASLQLVDEQIVAGPDWPDAQTLDGYWLSLRTPVGEYDLAGLMSKIPRYQQPEVVVCLLDAGLRSVPRNLHHFSGTKILVIGDPDEGGPTASEIFHYVALEPFERVMFRTDQEQLQSFLAKAAPGLPAIARLEDWTEWNPSAAARSG